MFPKEMTREDSKEWEGSRGGNMTDDATPLKLDLCSTKQNN